MSLATVLAEDRRLVILRALHEAHDYSLNESVLKKVLETFGHAVSRDLVRADVAWLAEQRLVRAVPVEGAATVGLSVVRLTEDGGDVARGRYHPGVARPSPR